MKKRIVIILVVVVVIAGVVAGVVAQPYRIIPAYIEEVNIVIDTESLLPQYCLRVVAGGPTTCWRPWRYCVTRFGNMIFVQVLTLHRRGEICGQAFTWEEKIIPLDSCLIPCEIYTVVVNGQWRLLVAGWWNGIKE